MPSRPLVLAILDGFGELEDHPSNAITRAEPRVWNDLRQKFPWTTLDCSGEQVGLPCGLMGNSEVGHVNMGAGRVIFQEISRIDNSITDGTFFDNVALTGAVDHALRAPDRKLHLFGLVSDGGVHSSDRHLRAVLELAKRQGLIGDRVVVHAFLDGRDTSPKSAQRYLADLEQTMGRLGVGRVGTVLGRFFAMDRDKRWDRVQQAYDALTGGDTLVAESAAAAVEAAYARGEIDEFVLPTVVGASQRDRVSDGDAVIFFNFRTDRPRELTEAFVLDEFEGFERVHRPVDLHFATMTRYRADFPCPVAYAPLSLSGIFPEVVSEAGMSQLRIAETEKYAHVTFFFSGGDERPLPGERRILVPSPKVRTYDQQPSMSAPEVTDRLLAEIASDQCPDLVILNYANADMVGHTGNFEAAVAAVQALDQCLGRLAPAVLDRGGYLVVTADHGNSELMTNPDTGEAHTAHTTNPVPFLVAGPEMQNRTIRSGRLCDVATTLLPLLGLEPSEPMNGANLL